jgi:hypothetical protein
MDTPEDTRRLLRRALAGEHLHIDGTSYSLHDLTQLAVALQPGADLAIRHAASMSPIERASIATAGKGRVLFFMT